MIKVVLDTNALISAVIFGGKPDQILNLARTGKIQLFISPAILAEFGGILLSKFHFSPEMAAGATGEIGFLSTMVKPKRRLKVIQQDEPDNRVLECALTAKADYIVSGDGHLLALTAFCDIKIVNPTRFLEELSK